MTRYSRMFYCTSLCGILMLTAHGCAKSLSPKDLMRQRIVRQLEAAELDYTSLRLLNPPGATNPAPEELWVALNMTGMQRVISLEGLKDLPIRILRLSDTNVHTLYPLRGMQLVILAVNGTKIRDLEPLRGMPIKTLVIDDTRVIDLSPIAELPLETLTFDPSHIINGMEVLRSMESLKYINGMTSEKFWRQREMGVR